MEFLKGKNVIWFVVGGVLLLVLLSRKKADAAQGPVHSRHPSEATGGPPRVAVVKPLTTTEMMEIRAAPKTRTGATAF